MPKGLDFVDSQIVRIFSINSILVCYIASAPQVVDSYRYVVTL